MARLLRMALEEQSKATPKEIEELIKQAVRDPFLGEEVLLQKTKIKLFYHEGQLAGCCWPSRDSDGRYRTGPIFVLPKYRGKGVASTFIIEYFQNRKGRAYIKPSNNASIATFKKAGFYKAVKSARNKNDEFDLYHKD